METEKKQLSDAGTLRVIADWFESEQQRTSGAWPELPARIQQHLRRIADSLERAPTPPNTPAEAMTPKSGRRVTFWNVHGRPRGPGCWFRCGDVTGYISTRHFIEKCQDKELSCLVPNEWPDVLDHLDAIDAFVASQVSAKLPRFDRTTWPLGAWVRHKGCFNQRAFFPSEVNTEGLVVGRDVWTWGYLAQDAEMTTDAGTTWRDCVP